MDANGGVGKAHVRSAGGAVKGAKWREDGVEREGNWGRRGGARMVAKSMCWGTWLRKKSSPERLGSLPGFSARRASLDEGP